MTNKGKAPYADGLWYLLKNHPLHVYVNVDGLPEHVGTFSTPERAQRACDDHNRTGAYVELPDSPNVMRLVMDYHYDARPAIAMKTVGMAPDSWLGLYSGPAQETQREYRITEGTTDKAAPGQLRSILRHKDAPKLNGWDAGW
jgi:hypothetical protein